MRERLVSFEVRDPDPSVLVVTNLWPHEEDPAYGIFVKRQVDSLRKRGLRVDVLFARGYASPAAYAAAALKLARLSRAGRPGYDLVHVHGGETVLAAIAYRRAPIVASYLGDDLLGTRKADGRFPLARRLRRAVLRCSAYTVARTITKSREMEVALPERRRSRNDVIPSGVDARAFVPMPRAQARSVLGWDQNAKIVLFGGNPRFAGKRLWLAEAACAAAERQVGAIQLETMSGIAPQDVPLVMNASDCLLLTSITEGSPNVVKEALMCNVPVISTPVGDVADLLENVSPSWICAPSVDALAGAIAKCVRLGTRSNGRSTSLHLNTGVIAGLILGVYRELGLGDRPLPSARTASGTGDGGGRAEEPPMVVRAGWARRLGGS